MYNLIKILHLLKINIDRDNRVYGFQLLLILKSLLYRFDLKQETINLH
jgi:hypothetical protein